MIYTEKWHSKETKYINCWPKYYETLPGYTNAKHALTIGSLYMPNDAYKPSSSMI